MQKFHEKGHSGCVRSIACGGRYLATGGTDETIKYVILILSMLFNVSPVSLHMYLKCILPCMCGLEVHMLDNLV